MGSSAEARKAAEKRDRDGAKRTSTKHLYAAIEHRVIDSPAYADLSFSAQALLVLIARQLTQDNNGHLHATYGWCKARGFGSEHTLKAAIADLISHGFIYRTRSHGANGAWARYAVTWKPIKKRDGLYLDGYVDCAWRYWEPGSTGPPQKKAPLKNCGNDPAESAVSPPHSQQKVQESTPQKLQSMN